MTNIWIAWCYLKYPVPREHWHLASLHYISCKIARNPTPRKRRKLVSIPLTAVDPFYQASLLAHTLASMLTKTPMHSLKISWGNKAKRIGFRSKHSGSNPNSATSQLCNLGKSYLTTLSLNILIGKCLKWSRLEFTWFVKVKEIAFLK